MDISIARSSPEQARIVEQTLRLMNVPDPSGNSWKFVQLGMYLTYNSDGVYQAVLLKFVDQNSTVLYTIIGNSPYPKYYTTLPWEEAN